MDCFHILRISATSTPKHASDDDDLYHIAGELSLQVAENSFCLSDTFTLCLLGIPIELTIKDLTSFLEPYESEIYEMQVIYNKSLHGYKCAILTFVDKLGVVAFTNLYNNLHFPSSSGLIAPCVAVPALILRDAASIVPFRLHEAYPLPQCIFCISKLHTRLSHIDIPLQHEHYSRIDNRCLVCDIYNNTSHQSRVCCTCQLHENLWVCLLCGHAGCGSMLNTIFRPQFGVGYWTVMKHYECLRCDRIWDYARDTFVHADLPVQSDISMDEPTLSKITNLQTEYEALLELQLEDQRLYYEKMLARETVRLLESGHQAAEMTIESKEDTFPTSSTLETIKMDISMQEYAYSQLLDEIRAAEQRTADLRKRNNKLIKEQKDMRSKCAELAKRKEDLRKRRETKSEQLQQEITDLEFYVRMQHEVEASPLKDEVRSGVMIVAEDSGAGNGRKEKHRKRGQRR